MCLSKGFQEAQKTIHFETCVYADLESMNVDDVR